MQRTITALTIIVLLATKSVAGTFMPDSVANKIETTEISDSTLTATPDSTSFEMPDYMLQEMDSLLNCWQARNLLKKLESFPDSIGNVKISDTLYAERLQSMPTIPSTNYL